MSPGPGQIARRAMELGGVPVRCDAPERDTPQHLAPEHDTPKLSEVRLVQAMRKIDSDLAAMIESLAPVYLVKR